ncbi:hypothetical protein A2947_02280 [Candidatus Peribacteria bacterium RIFCSPLOWO2_01_FULL_54_110]|nr:MAG: hypothetical protein A2947_02280 [Candidatus Peribacteria bacterium RIFCSPLOWO2_01_FULL_54_110]
MKKNNLNTLKEFLRETTDCFSERGAVYQGPRLQTEATKQMRTTFAEFSAEIYCASSFDEIAAIACEMRMASVANNFFPPREDVSFYERLVAVKVLGEERLLDNVDWWRAASLR